MPAIRSTLLNWAPKPTKTRTPFVMVDGNILLVSGARRTGEKLTVPCYFGGLYRGCFRNPFPRSLLTQVLPPAAENYA